MSVVSKNYLHWQAGQGGERMETANVQIISDGMLTRVEVNGIEIPVTSVHFQHVGGSVPKVTLEFPVDGTTVQTTNTAIIKKMDSHTECAI